MAAKTVLSLALAITPLHLASAQTLSSDQLLREGAKLCQQEVYRAYAEKPLGPQRGFSMQDVEVSIHPILKQRLDSSPDAQAAVRSAGTSYRWHVAVKHASGSCDIAPNTRPRIIVSNWDPR
jgi:hypothetical protein